MSDIGDVAAVVESALTALAESPEVDPFRVYEVGDDDNTFYDSSILDANYCDSREPEYGFVCTRWHVHGGNHAAGTGDYIAEVWS